MSNTVVILNPAAGSAAAQTEAVEHLARLHEIELRSPSGKSELAGLVKSLAAEGVGRLIVAGGDGTISRVVNSLLPDYPHVELAVIPLGTANDLARSLELPLVDVDAAFQLAITRPTTPIDVALVQKGTESYFVNAATGGFGGEVTAGLTAENKQFWGSFAYWWSGMAKLVDLHAFDLELTLDGETSRQKVFGIGVANGRYVGGGFPIGPQAMLNDGFLDITIVPELPSLELLSLGLTYMLGRLAEGSALTIKRAARVAIHALPDMPISLDGEATHAFDAVFEVVPRALQIVANENAAALQPSAGTT